MFHRHAHKPPRKCSSAVPKRIGAPQPPDTTNKTAASHALVLGGQRTASREIRRDHRIAFRQPPFAPVFFRRNVVSSSQIPPEAFVACRACSLGRYGRADGGFRVAHIIMIFRRRIMQQSARSKHSRASLLRSKSIWQSPSRRSASTAPPARPVQPAPFAQATDGFARATFAASP